MNTLEVKKGPSMSVNWWGVVNQALTGFCWGAGFSLAFVLCLVIVPWAVKRLS